MTADLKFGEILEEVRSWNAKCLLNEIAQFRVALIKPSARCNYDKIGISERER